MKNKSFNCMGYALNRKKWMHFPVPYNQAVQHLLAHYPLKLVSKKDMKLGKTYIAFKYGSNDFHFAKRDKRGHWSHKMGSLDPTSISQKEVFKRVWNTNWARYTSKLYLFEVQEM